MIGAMATIRPTAALAAALAALGTPLPGKPEAALLEQLSARIQHVIVLYPENRSFDNIYGYFPGANGVLQAKRAQFRQVDRDGRALAFLGQPSQGPSMKLPPFVNEDRFGHSIAALLAPPPNGAYLANFYYDADRFVAIGDVGADPVHRFYTEQYQIGGADDPRYGAAPPMSRFAAWSNHPELVMGVYDAQDLGEGRVAREFTMCDNAFHSAFGGSFLNHFWLVSARTPVWRDRADGPAGQDPYVRVTKFDEKGLPKIDDTTTWDGELTNDRRLGRFPASNWGQSLGPEDYWAVNTLQPAQGPAVAPPASRLPLQEFDTIGDRLTESGVTWAWFSGGWDDAKAGRASPLFQYHHQPFAYFRRYALKSPPAQETAVTPAVPGGDSDGSREHLKDESVFLAALLDGTLPQVSFVKPLGKYSGHPGQSSVVSEQNWVADIVARIRKSEYWDKVAIFITPDENGGLWDHVEPPRVDTWGPGTRVPLIVVSPCAKRGFVDHTQYETASILRFIELRWNLRPLNSRDAAAAAPMDCFDFGRAGDN